MRNNEIENEIDLIYRGNKYKYDFEQYDMIISFGESIYTDKITIDEAEEDQRNLLENMVEFNNKSRQKQRR